MNKLKNEVDQPSIKSFVQLHSSKLPSEGRSIPVKRKPSAETVGTPKRHITSPDITTNMTAALNTCQNDLLRKIEEATGVDSNLLRAIEMLLQPLRHDIHTLVQAQTETRVL